MQPILVAYGTTEGQTGKIAEFIAERLRSKDVEYTDWADVESFVDEFLAAAGIPGSAKSA